MFAAFHNQSPLITMVRVASCNFKLFGYFISLPITHSKQYDMQTWYYFRPQVKRFLRAKRCQSSCQRAKWSWLVGVRRRKRFGLDGNSLLRSSLYQYINNQQHIVLKRQLSTSSDIHAHPRPVIPSFGSNRGQVTRK